MGGYLEKMSELKKKIQNILHPELEEENKMLQVSLQRLEPPRAPKPPEPAREEKAIVYNIDWKKLAESSDFKRLIYLAVEGHTWRGKDKDLEKHLDNKLTVLRDPNFSSVIKDMKAHFQNGLLKPSEMRKEVMEKDE
jgi:hypothetical protein